MKFLPYWHDNALVFAAAAEGPVDGHYDVAKGAEPERNSRATNSLSASASSNRRCSCPLVHPHYDHEPDTRGAAEPTVLCTLSAQLGAIAAASSPAA